MSDFQVPRLLVFGLTTLDTGRRVLLRIGSDGLTNEIRLSSAEALILAYLLVNAGEVCSKEVLLTVGWEGKPISPNSLTVAIANLRRYMQVAPAELEIRSIPKKGYLLSLFAPLRERVLDPTEQGDGDEPVVPPLSSGEEQQAEPLSASAAFRGEPEQNSAVEAIPHAVTPSSRLHKLTAFFTPYVRRRLMIWGNLLILLLLILLLFMMRFEWLSVACRVQDGATVCIMDERHPFLPEIKQGQDPADTLYLVAGKSVIVLSKQQLLDSSGEEEDEAK